MDYNAWKKHITEDRVASVKGFNKLSESHKKLFMRVYLAHLSAMGTDFRQKYLPDNLKSIKWVPEKNCFHVFWHGDTEWFHYDTRGCWY
ncbi:hypothetical protein J2S74_002277 [Evansella vedderi]|uniref:Uncharacterized protein n=1 Tax=Evansella vedderi TaxID=38282 RepID=A0ABT9ZUH1_9BACI|nr:hypothetical protein [Evansella vedderi]MDQ0254895.1 hypothetical protein [Evansella vedderi]